MTKLLVQEFFLGGGTYEQLNELHQVKSRVNGNKVSLSYDKVFASNSNPIAKECRGLILRPGSWDIVAFPFRRFFNHGEGEAADIHWESAAFETKMDGTLGIVYYDDELDSWCFATRSVSDASGNVNDSSMTFAQLADIAAQHHKATDIHDLMSRLPHDARNRTFMFELTSKYNQIVCQYADTSLTLIGVRNIETFLEESPDAWADALGVPVPQRWEFANVNHLIQVIREWSPKTHEGVVVKDKNFDRIKVKAPQYLAAHHASDSVGASWRSCASVVVSGISDDLLSILPQLAVDRVEAFRDVLAKVITHVENDVSELAHIEDMKEYAGHATQKLWSGALFAVKRGKSKSVREYVERSQTDSLLEVCDKVSPGWRDKLNPVSEDEKE